jgi:hypothetical protein
MAAQLKPVERLICPALASRYGALRWLAASVTGSARYQQ